MVLDWTPSHILKRSAQSIDSQTPRSSQAFSFMYHYRIFISSFYSSRSALFPLLEAFLAQPCESPPLPIQEEYDRFSAVDTIDAEDPAALNKGAAIEGATQRKTPDI